jgi:hypothetical protein
LIEVEALTVSADEAVTNLPPRPLGKCGKTLARLLGWPAPEQRGSSTVTTA